LVFYCRTTSASTAPRSPVLVLLKVSHFKRAAGTVLCENVAQNHGGRYCNLRKVDVRLPGTGHSNSHGARPVHLIITMIKWIRTSRLSIKKSLSTVSRAMLTSVRSAAGEGADYFAEMRSGSEEGSYLRLMDFVYHSTVGLRVIKKKRRGEGAGVRATGPYFSRNRARTHTGFRV